MMTCETAKLDKTVTYELYLLDEDDADPSDGELVASAEGTYGYGGFHRKTLAGEEWVLVREGQRDAVVVTQFCNADGKCYQSSAMNRAQMGPEEIAQMEQSFRGFCENLIFLRCSEELTVVRFECRSFGECVGDGPCGARRVLLWYACVALGHTHTANEHHAKGAQFP